MDENDSVKLPRDAQYVCVSVQGEAVITGCREIVPSRCECRIYTRVHGQETQGPLALRANPETSGC